MLTLGCSSKQGHRLRLKTADGVVIWLAVSRNPPDTGGYGRVTIDAPRDVEILREKFVPDDERPVWTARKGKK